MWRVSPAGLLASQIAMVATGIAIAAVTTWVLVSPEADRLAAVLVAAFGIVIGLVLWRTAIHPGVVATEDLLVIRNPLETVTFRWPDIVEVVPGFDGVTVTSISSPPKAAWAVQKSNLSTWRGAQTRADVVAARLWDLATERGAVGSADEGVRSLPQREVELYDAVRRPLRFPWRMTRVEASVIGFLRHSSSPVLMAGAAAVFGVLGLVNAGLVVVGQWDARCTR